MYKTAHKYYKILGISIISRHPHAVLRQIRQNVLQNRKFLIVTPNPEQIIKAQNDQKFAKILNRAEISIPDGVGLGAAVKFLSLPNPKYTISRLPVLILQGIYVGLLLILNKKEVESELKIIKGRELFLNIIRIANKKSWKVVLLGDKFESAQKALKKITANYKNVQLSALTGPNLDDDANCISAEDQKIEESTVEKINAVKPHFLFVGFRAPVQEKWLYKWLPKLKVNGTMVVGSTFDYMSGKSKLPPRWIENVGLEWFWRLLTGSQKLKRILVAFPTFPAKVFLQKFNQ